MQTRREHLALCHWVNNWQVVSKTHFPILRPVWFFFPPSMLALLSFLLVILLFFLPILTLNAFMLAAHHKHEAFPNLPPNFSWKFLVPKSPKQSLLGKEKACSWYLKCEDSRGFTFQVSVERLKNSSSGGGVCISTLCPLQTKDPYHTGTR